MYAKPWLLKTPRASQGQTHFFEPWLKKTKSGSQGLFCQPNPGCEKHRTPARVSTLFRNLAGKNEVR